MLKKVVLWGSLAVLTSVSFVMANPATDPLQETKKVMSTGATLVVGILFMIVVGLGIASVVMSIKGYMEGVQKAKQDQSNPVMAGLIGIISGGGVWWIFTFLAVYVLSYLTGGNLINIITNYISRSLG